MKKDRRFKIDRRLLIAAAVIALIFTIIIFLDQNGQDGRNMAKRISILIRTMLPELFLFAALRFPTMIYSTALAAIGAFWSVYFALLIPAVLLISQNPVSGSSLSAHDRCTCDVFSAGAADVSLSPTWGKQLVPIHVLS